MTDVAEWVLNKCVLPGIHTNTLLNGSPTVVAQDEGTDLGEDKPENNKGGVYKTTVVLSKQVHWYININPIQK